MAQLKRKATTLSLYANQLFQEGRHIVGFPKKQPLCFGFGHTLSEWEALYTNIRSTPFLLETFPLVRKKRVNQFQVYALTFELLIEQLCKIQISPFILSHFMLGPHRLSQILESQIQIRALKKALVLFSSDPSKLTQDQFNLKKKFYQNCHFTPGWTQMHDRALLDAALKTGLTHITKILQTKWNFLPDPNKTAPQKLSILILGEGYEKELQIEEGLMKQRINQVVIDALIMRLKMITELMIQE